MPALNCVGCSAQSPKNNYNMKWDGRKCRGEAAWEPMILSLETAMESIIWHLHIAAPLTLSHTTSSGTSRRWMNAPQMSTALTALGIPCTCLTHLCSPMHLAAQWSAQSSWRVTARLRGAGVWISHCYGPWCKSHIHSECYSAKCTKLLETLFRGKVTSSPIFQFIPVWKSPSGGSYVGCPFSGHELTLI